MTHRQRKSRRRRRPKARGKILLGVGVLATVPLIAIASAAGYVLAIASSAPGAERAEGGRQGRGLRGLRRGRLRLGFVQSDVLRRVVPFRDMPPEMRQATVAIEDERFYKHEGVDFNAIIRAGIKNLESGKTVQGGSTITQQLVRALYIRDPKRDFARKIREAKLASEFEEKRSKRWILHEYLNSVPYGTVGGRTAIGAQAAAVTFFSKDVDELNLAESALLAGLPQAPSEYNPFRNPQAALSRRNEVPVAMFENGYISQVELFEGCRTSWSMAEERHAGQGAASLLFDYVQEELIERYGVGVVRRGGLKIHTTVQPGLQDAAREAINAYYGDPCRPPRRSWRSTRPPARSARWRRAGPTVSGAQPRRPGPPPARLGVQDVRAHGGDPRRGRPGFDELHLEAAQHQRPRVRALGGQDLRQQLLGHGQPHARDARVGQHGLRAADPRSRPRQGLQGGEAARHHDEARLLSGRGPRRPTRGVTTLEMANAYATLASGGIRHKVTGIERVVFPDGKSERLRTRRASVMTDGQAYEVTKILEMNVTSGTGTAAGWLAARGGQDGDDRRGEGRLVRGLHAAPPRRRSGSAIRTPASRCRAPRAEPTPRPSGTPSCCPPATATATTSRSRPRRSCPRPSSAST